MAGLFEGVSPPDINKTTTTAQQTPEYLTKYLTNLAEVGTGALGTATPAVKDAQGNVITPGSFTPKTGEELIASRPDYLRNLQQGIDPATGKEYTSGSLPSLGNLQTYQGTMQDAASLAKTAGQSIGLTYDQKGNPIFSDALKSFYDPFKQQVIDEMQRQSDINLQRSILPSLKALGISSGQGGSSRMRSIGGQALADIASNLQAQQTAARSKGFETALDAALKQQQQQGQIAGTLGTIGTGEAAATRGALNTLADIGGQDVTYEQSKIDAPLTRAANVAALMRGYSYPTTTTETYKGPGTIYGPSKFQQITGTGALISSLFPQGGQGIGSQAVKGLKDYLAEQQSKNLAINMADIDRIVSESGSGGTMGSEELEDFFNNILGTGSGGWLGNYDDQSTDPGED